MSLKDKEKWNHKYEVPEYIAGKEPVEWLKDHSGLLKRKGSALDIASGEGRNAVFAAENGYQTAKRIFDKNVINVTQMSYIEERLLNEKAYID